MKKSYFTKDWEKESGYKTGFTDIDNYTGGLKKGEILLLVKRPGTGGTSLALSMAQNIAEGNDKVIFFSVDSAEKEIFLRLLRMNNNHSSGLRNLPLLIEDMLFPNNVSLLDRCLVNTEYMKNCKVIVIDGLEHLTSDYAYNTRKEELENICRVMKSNLYLLDVPIILTVTIDENNGSDGSKRPGLKDLRALACIDRIVDYILFLHRDETEHSDSPAKQIMEIEAYTRRHKKSEPINICFLPDTLRCENLEERHEKP